MSDIKLPAAWEKAMFPIKRQRGAKPHPTKIPWEIADLAYSVYSAWCGDGQSLERLAELGGFGPAEMDEYLPDWRERCSSVQLWKNRCLRLREALEEIKCYGHSELCQTMKPVRPSYHCQYEEAEQALAELKRDIAGEEYILGEI